MKVISELKYKPTTYWAAYVFCVVGYSVLTYLAYVGLYEGLSGLEVQNEKFTVVNGDALFIFACLNFFGALIWKLATKFKQGSVGSAMLVAPVAAALWLLINAHPHFFDVVPRFRGLIWLGLTFLSFVTIKLGEFAAYLPWLKQIIDFGATRNPSRVVYEGNDPAGAE